MDKSFCVTDRSSLNSNVNAPSSLHLKLIFSADGGFASMCYLFRWDNPGKLDKESEYRYILSPETVMFFLLTEHQYC